MVHELHVHNVKYSVYPQEAQAVLQTLQVAEGLLHIRCDRAEGWKEAMECMWRNWGPKFLLQMVLIFDTEQRAMQCAHALHGRWISGLSREGDDTCHLTGK